ncbi:hypothetical protein J1605_001811 [Eschrichtius robustus]|uniref:Uncharacterized protein n=1 Tax=Eschrichtius robustus TaxID=9764 RepID=A0AB34I1L1_ESCRO|nr:hypothetical protein J1605_001811 [Eschrichtius robustus]
MWDLPGPGVEPVSPALAGGPPTTAPPGKSLYFLNSDFTRNPISSLNLYIWHHENTKLSLSLTAVHTFSYLVCPHSTFYLFHRIFHFCLVLTIKDQGMWDLPGPGLEPVSPALAGGFLTTVPPAKP